jgi:hypothetical protein
MKNKQTIGTPVGIKRYSAKHFIALMKLNEKRMREKAFEFSKKTYELLCLTSENQLENVKRHIYHR